MFNHELQRLVKLLAALEPLNIYIFGVLQVLASETETVRTENVGGINVVGSMLPIFL